MADKASLWKPANDPRTGENAHRTTCRCHRRRCQTRAPAVLSESPVQRSLTARGHRTPGRTYYYNKQTRETTWTKPLELSSPEERVRSRCCAAYPLQRPARLHGRPGAPCDDGPEGLGPRTHAPTHPHPNHTMCHTTPASASGRMPTGRSGSSSKRWRTTCDGTWRTASSRPTSLPAPRFVVQEYTACLPASDLRHYSWSLGTLRAHAAGHSCQSFA